MAKVNYLNNRDLLREIHKSKMAYSSYLTDDDAYYDVIVPSLNLIDDEVLAEGKKNRAARLGRNAWEAALKQNPKTKLDEHKIDPETMEVKDLVFRVMTFDHIPLEPGRKKSPKTKGDHHTKVNFPPFQHFRLDENNIPFCVGKSHWIGGLQNGYFSKDHGQITNKLAMMFMKLTEKYATRGNWRGYCVDTETTALTQRGWLGIDEINETDMILSYQDGFLKWSKIKSIYRGQYSGKMHKISGMDMNALITPNHKILTERGLINVEWVTGSDKIIYTGQPVLDDIHVKESTDMMTMDSVVSLTHGQRTALIRTMFNGKNSIIFADLESTLAFAALCTINGKRVKVDQNEFTVSLDATLKKVGAGADLVFNDDKCGSHISGARVPSVEYDSMVWCPETQFGSFMAMRNGTIYLTGNSYNDEMRSQALLQLSQISLQFDESKGSNPFAYYTASLKNSFIRVLNLEKRQQSIRDEILEMNDMTPSHTRLNENE